MRQRDLEIALEKVPPHPAPKPALEQYRTPPTIAADVLFRAYALGDLAERRVLDLGCGTGMLAIGASRLGADAVGVDVDAGALDAARLAAAALGVTPRFVEADVRALPDLGRFDAVLSNPPFGAQTPHADRPFLDAALRLAPVAYTFHLSTTLDFVRRTVEAGGARVTHAWDYAFPLPWQFAHHTKAVERVPVTVVRFARAA